MDTVTGVSVPIPRIRVAQAFNETKTFTPATGFPYKQVMPAPTFSDIQDAARAIAPALVRTPTRHSRTLSGIAGCDVWLKFENRQFTASFKERGALNRILSLSEDEKKRGVAAMSAGNHAQCVAYHAS